MGTGARARGLAGWARGRALGDGVSGRRVTAAKVPGVFTRMTAHSGRVLDPPLRMPAKTTRGGARCAILIDSTAIRNLRIRLKSHDMFFSNRSKIACLRARFAHVSRSKNHDSRCACRGSRFTNHQSLLTNHAFLIASFSAVLGCRREYANQEIGVPRSALLTGHESRFTSHESRFTWHRANLFHGCRKSKCMRLKFERGGEMLGEIIPIMAAGIEMEFVRNAACRQQLVELLVALVEAKLIVGAAIEIDLQARRTRLIFDNREWAFALPECLVYSRTEGLSQHFRHCGGLIAGDLDIRQRINQRGAVRAHRGEQIRILQREAQ